MTSGSTVDSGAAIKAQAELHHAYLLGLLLMVSSNRPGAVVEDWIYRLFSHQHRERFLPGLVKLGLADLPDAIACARYHVLSNGIGGVPVEYMEEGPDKAWVRFRYPRWMYDGPTLCGVPVGVSRGFLRGWYARNGVSLGNPRLGFVCVSEDMTGEFGFCGYFREYSHQLEDKDRLRFCRDERPPPFDPSVQPVPLTAGWSAERLLKASRNYAVEYIRNGLRALAETVGPAAARDLGGRAARLIGMQYYARTAELVDATDGGIDHAAEYLARMLAGMGDTAEIEAGSTAGQGQRAVLIRQNGLRIARGVDQDMQSLILDCWHQLWLGTIRAHREMMTLEVEPDGKDRLGWRLMSD